MDLEQTNSVAKGCFAFKNGPNRANLKRRKSVVDTNDSALWYQAYQSVKNSTDLMIAEIQCRTNTKAKAKLIEFVKNAQDNNLKREDNLNLNILPTAVLLTGVNQEDYYSFFNTFTYDIESPVAVIQARKCLTLKSTIEQIAFGLTEKHRSENEKENLPSTMLRHHYNIQMLKSWYNETFDTKGPVLTIVIPDFEIFSMDVLIDFLQLLVTLTAELPIVLILGIATDINILERTLPYSIINKLQLTILQTNSSKQCLNKILDEVLLSPQVCVKLSGTVLDFLADNFLFFDFSINSFIKGYQFCLMDHYHQRNAYSLCRPTFAESLQIREKLNHKDIRELRQLPSFEAYVESLSDPQLIIDILEDDNKFRAHLAPLLRNIYMYFSEFHCFTKLLVVMLQHLPNENKQCRDIYSQCSSTNIFTTEQFKNSWQLLTLLSKEKFLQTLNEAVTTLNKYKLNFCPKDIIGYDTAEHIDKVIEEITDIQEEFQKFNATETVIDNKPSKLTKNYKEELKNIIVEQASSARPAIDTRMQMEKALTTIKKKISRYLIPFNEMPLHELFVFDDMNSVREHISGSPRAALHSALQNPQTYLQCNCCTLEDSSQLIATLPDISVAFKLHLESGHMINLFDWLQAFNIILSKSCDDTEEIHPEIQARFTRAVAELEFLGYIKSSKRKTDHVSRLTW